VVIVRKMLESCENRASVAQSHPQAWRTLPPMLLSYAGERKGSLLHHEGRYKRDEVAMGRQRRVPGGSLRDWSVLTGALPVARLCTHALEVASRWALGVVATYCRNSAVK
jgi:hypothetical protein